MERGNLVLTRKEGEAVLLKLGVVEVRVHVVAIREQGSRVKLGFQAPPAVLISREELGEPCKPSN
jgi:carbon storage regulator CsrA